MPRAAIVLPKLTARERRNRLARRNAWLAQTDAAALLQNVIDFFPGVYFFAKDRSGEMMFLNRANQGVYGITDPAFGDGQQSLGMPGPGGSTRSDDCYRRQLCRLPFPIV